MKLIELIQKKISRYDDTHNFTCDNCGKEVFDGKRLCKNCKEELPYNNKTALQKLQRGVAVQQQNGMPFLRAADQRGRRLPRLQTEAA